MSKLKFVLLLFSINLLFSNNICFSKTTEAGKWNSRSYIGININIQISTNKNISFELASLKTYYTYLLNKKRFSIGPKIFTLMDISDKTNNYYNYNSRKQFIESALFKNNKIGLGLSIGFDLSDNVSLIGTIGGVKQFKKFPRSRYSDFGYDLEISMQIALGRNMNAQVSFGRMSFSKNSGNYNIKPPHENAKPKDCHRRHSWTPGKLPEKINIDSVSVGLSYKF